MAKLLRFAFGHLTDSLSLSLSVSYLDYHRHKSPERILRNFTRLSLTLIYAEL